MLNLCLLIRQLFNHHKIKCHKVNHQIQTMELLKVLRHRRVVLLVTMLLYPKVSQKTVFSLPILQERRIPHQTYQEIEAMHLLTEEHLLLNHRRITMQDSLNQNPEEVQVHLAIQLQLEKQKEHIIILLIQNIVDMFRITRASQDMMTGLQLKTMIN